MKKEGKDLIASFEEAKEIEEKISIGLESMKHFLSDPKRKSLKDFWAIKHLVSSFFKEKINPAQRSHFWSEYIQLSNVAYRLKEMEDEQTAFSIKQVNLAIEGLEKDLDRFADLTEQAPPLFFPRHLKPLSLNKETYSRVQKELWVLKLLIVRLESLRREVISIDMRMSHKNKILKHLSHLGDTVFPKKKHLIEEVSQSFLLDVDSFVEKRRFKEQEKLGSPQSYYRIREEIKDLQNFAKALTLSAQSFFKVRQLLSDFWNATLEKEKQAREELEKHFKAGKKDYDACLLKVEAFETFCAQKKGMDRERILDKSNALYQELKKGSLCHAQIKNLKEKIQKVESAALQEVHMEAQKVEEAIRIERDRLRERLDALLQNLEEVSFEEIEKEGAEIEETRRKLILSEIESDRFGRTFAQLKSFILSEKEKKTDLKDLHALYEEKVAHIQAIQNQMSAYKKRMNRSNLDFERAILYRELYESGKKHLSSELKALERLEEKLI